MANLLKYYAREWNRPQFIITGYSQGAEIVPFLFTGLPEEMKYNVKSLLIFHLVKQLILKYILPTCLDWEINRTALM